MANHALLDAAKHKSLHVKPGYSPAYGDDEMSAITFPHEFRSIQADYPIFFKKDHKTGEFFPVALLGLRSQENLFLSDNGWDAFYVPASVRRRPFLIGTTPQASAYNQVNTNNKVYIDLDSPRLSENEGQALFLEHGGYSPYLNTALELLEFIQYGIDLNKSFSAALVQHNLLESINLKISLTDGECLMLEGFYTVNEDKLASLAVDAVTKLHCSGYLQHLHMVLASHANVARLVKLAEKRLREK